MNVGIRNKIAFALTIATAVAIFSAVWGTAQRLKESREFYVTGFHSLYGSFDGGVFKFSLDDFEKNVPLTHEEYERHRFSGLPKNFFAQSANPLSNGGLVVTGGRPGMSADAGKIYEISREGELKTLKNTEEYRFRNVGKGTIGGEAVFGAVTHGKGQVYLKWLESGKERLVNAPYVPSVNVWGNKFHTLLHFVDFIDLDHDGDDEVYFTSTSPYLGVQGSQSQYAEGTVMSLKFEKATGKPVLENIGIPLPAFPRRQLAMRAPYTEGLLVLFEGMLNGDGESVLPIRLYRMTRDAEGKIEKKELLSIPGHQECKTITTYRIKPYPTIQVGCDDSTLYVLRETEKGLEIDDVLKFSEELLSKEYSVKRSSLKPWSIYSIHAVFGKDVNGDGFDEMVVLVNNDGFYLVDPKNPKDRSKTIKFGFSDGGRVLDRDESFVFTDGTFKFVGNELGEDILSKRK